jgi:benzoylformate decarboxylase
MADGYAQATGRPTHVNLRTAPGLGNAVGGIFNAQANKSPLVITAGQQVRPQITIEANLTNREATLRDAIAAEDGPRLVQVRVASGMWLE